MFIVGLLKMFLSAPSVGVPVSVSLEVNALKKREKSEECLQTFEFITP